MHQVDNPLNKGNTSNINMADLAYYRRDSYF